MPTPPSKPGGATEADALAAAVEALTAAYSEGAFPMADGGKGRIRWYSPDPRAVLPIDAAPGQPGGIRVSRSLRAAVRQRRFEIATDTCFETVMRSCAVPRGSGGEWISPPMVGVYAAMHRAGRAHSVEAWLPALPALGRERTLVGGLYGVHLGGAFFGESMCSHPELGGTDSSKVCLVHLVNHLRARGFVLLDTQFANPHMEQFGIVEITRKNYLAKLREALAINAAWQPWAA